jgi:glycosyltransferase involved in cell wall biosynthesis/O-antigen/teichoic acid export membrane protein
MSQAIADLATFSLEPQRMSPRRSIFSFFSAAGKKSSWVLADQATVSIGNFATTILIGRAITSAQFGTYGLLMELYLFFNSLQSALVVYPLSLRGAVLEKPALQRMASACLFFTLFLCIPLSLAMAGTTVVFHQSSILVWVVLAMILGQVQETLRRTLLAHLQFQDAIPGDAVSYLLQAAILLVLMRHGHLNLATAFITMAATSAMAAILQAFQIGLRAIALHDLPGIFKDFWHVGRWILYSNLTAVVASLGYNWTLALKWNTTQVAYLYVIASPMKVVNPLITAVGSIIVPSVSRVHHHAGLAAAKRVGLKYAAMGFTVLAPYLLFLFIFPSTCIRILFGDRPEYLGLANFLRIFTVTYTLSYVANASLSCLNGLGHSRANFVTTVANAIVSALIGLPLAYAFGLWGVILGGFVATATYFSFAIGQLILLPTDDNSAGARNSAARGTNRMTTRPKIAFVNQPWGRVEPPVHSGGSIPIILYELARQMTSQASLLYYTRAAFLPHHKIVEEIDYRYIPLAADKFLQRAVNLASSREGALKPSFAGALTYQGYGVQIALSLRRQRADVVHIANFSQFIPVIRYFNPSAVIALHMQCEWLSQLDEKMIRERLRHVDLILGCSNFITDLVRRRFPEFAQRCGTVYNGVDHQRFQERIPLSPDAPPRKIVFVGRISPEKGIHVLIQAFAKIAAEYPDVSLDLVGPDEINAPSLVVPLTEDPLVSELLPWYSSTAYRAALDKLLTPEIRDRVRFLGNFAHSEGLANAYRSGDVCVIPSVWEEPFGIPVIEAMACGVPVIATRGGAFPEIIEHEKTGLLVARGSVDELAAALRRLLGDGKLRIELGRAGRRRAVDQFSWSQSAATALAYYYSARPILGTTSSKAIQPRTLESAETSCL